MPDREKNQEDQFSKLKREVSKTLGYYYRIQFPDEDSRDVIEFWIDNVSTSLYDYNDDLIKECYIQLYDDSMAVKDEVTIAEEGDFGELLSSILPHRSRLLMRYNIKNEFTINVNDTLTLATESGLYFEYKYVGKAEWQLITFHDDQ